MNKPIIRRVIVAKDERFEKVYSQGGGILFNAVKTFIITAPTKATRIDLLNFRRTFDYV